MANIRNNILVVDVDPLNDDEYRPLTTWTTERKVAQRELSPVWVQWRGVKVIPLIPFAKFNRSRWQ